MNGPDARPELPSSAGAILSAATELFAQHGFHQVTVRDIAARASLSPAMVIKCWGSKEALFYRAARIVAPTLPDVPRVKLGTALVRELIERMETGELEVLNRALNLRLSAPDPASIREQFARAYFKPLAERLGGSVDANMRAELAVSALVGLAAGMRLFEAPGSTTAPESVVEQYGGAVQYLIDGAWPDG